MCEPLPMSVFGVVDEEAVFVGSTWENQGKTCVGGGRRRGKADEAPLNHSIDRCYIPQLKGYFPVWQARLFF